MRPPPLPVASEYNLLCCCVACNRPAGWLGLFGSILSGYFPFLYWWDSCLWEAHEGNTCVVVVLPGASQLGVSVRGQHGPAAGAGLQEDPAGPELPRAVGCLAGECRQPGPQAARGQYKLPQGSSPVPPQVVFLQVRLKLVGILASCVTKWCFVV